jgi:phospholipid/cholesterol/gamma-HCH transport system permease protein
MLMMPLLTLYANLMGIVGGALIAVGVMDLEPALYYHQTKGGVGLTDFAIGLTKSVAFGAIVALAGCMRGIQSGRNAAAVGMAATSAVVTSIVLIIVADGVFAVLTEALGI